MSGFNIEDVDKMDGTEFEDFCRKVLIKNGYKILETANSSCDYGGDIIAEKSKIKYVIQCKRSSKNIGYDAVKEVFTAANVYGCSVAVVLTNRKFTKGAINGAEKVNVTLWGRQDLIELMNYVSPELHKKKYTYIIQQKDEECLCSEYIKFFINKAFGSWDNINITLLGTPENYKDSLPEPDYFKKFYEKNSKRALTKIAADKIRGLFLCYLYNYVNGHSDHAWIISDSLTRYYRENLYIDTRQLIINKDRDHSRRLKIKQWKYLNDMFLDFFVDKTSFEMRELQLYIEKELHYIFESEDIRKTNDYLDDNNSLKGPGPLVTYHIFIVDDNDEIRYELEKELKRLENRYKSFEIIIHSYDNWNDVIITSRNYDVKVYIMDVINDLAYTEDAPNPYSDIKNVKDILIAQIPNDKMVPKFYIFTRCEKATVDMIFKDNSIEYCNKNKYGVYRLALLIMQYLQIECENEINPNLNNENKKNLAKYETLQPREQNDLVLHLSEMDRNKIVDLANKNGISIEELVIRAFEKTYCE